MESERQRVLTELLLQKQALERALDEIKRLPVFDWPTWNKIIDRINNEYNTELQNLALQEMQEQG